MEGNTAHGNLKELRDHSENSDKNMLYYEIPIPHAHRLFNFCDVLIFHSHTATSQLSFSGIVFHYTS